ncbi:amidase signature domain-containing protein [Schizophyllum amplum]|uniref:Amidase signature domain-containing protein n=1 Tax=Schizophyllum amplum TaxID=97359 RepID=A0A550C1P8_9AGAR|nr:amidase signature domain-containing protein [Auriculariopsis ampla]
MRVHEGLRRAFIPHGSRSISNDVSTYWRNIESWNGFTNALVCKLEPPAAAASMDSPSKLHGLPIAVKDNICTSDMPTTCSSAMLQTFTSPFDATVVRLLKENGMNVAGKTNCDEFGMGSLNVHSVHGPVVNPFPLMQARPPHDITDRRSAGGSSGGSAAAVAARMCYAALGTDTGGSIRLPASYCGVAGLKPSYGLVSRWGVVSYADSLDCVGVLATDTERVRDVFNIISVHDPRDPTSASVQTREAAQEQAKIRASQWRRNSPGLSGLRVGIPQVNDFSLGPVLRL